MPDYESPHKYMARSMAQRERERFRGRPQDKDALSKKGTLSLVAVGTMCNGFRFLSMHVERGAVSMWPWWW